MFSFDLNRLVSFPRFGGTNTSPSWSPDGSKLAFSSSRSGDSEIYIVDQSGGNSTDSLIPKALTFRQVGIANWDRKLAWVSGRTGLPRIYTMGSDGTNVQEMIEQGYGVSPAWSPNGQFLVFSWMRHYGAGAPGSEDIYIMDVASKQWVQLTHDGGRNDFHRGRRTGGTSYFSPIALGSLQIWTMLADGSNQKPFTTSGNNSEPDWSWK